MPTNKFCPPLSSKCTISVAAEILYMSEETAKRRLKALRQAKGYKPYHPITVGEFLEYYNILL